MILDRPVGDLVEPLTGRVWPGAGIGARGRVRRQWYRERGVRPGDRVLAHQGNTPEFLVDLLAVWSLGASVVPMDQRLTGFEVETLARAARPRLSVWLGAPDPGVATRLPALGVDVVEVPAESGAPGSDGHGLRGGLGRPLLRGQPGRRRARALHLGEHVGAQGRGPHPSLARRALGEPRRAPGDGVTAPHAVPAAVALRPRPDLQRAVPVAPRRHAARAAAVPARHRHPPRRRARRAPDHVHVVGARALAAGPPHRPAPGGPEPGARLLRLGAPVGDALARHPRVVGRARGGQRLRHHRDGELARRLRRCPTSSRRMGWSASRGAVASR